MAHRSVKDSALPIGNRHDHRLVPLALFAVSRSQNLDFFGRASEGIIQFILGVHPNLGHTLCDRMLRVTQSHFEQRFADHGFLRVRVEGPE